MDDKQRLKLLEEYNFSKIDSINYTRYTGFSNANVALLFNIENLIDHEWENPEEKDRLETLVYAQIGFMAIKYITHPTRNLPNQDDPDVIFLVRSEELTFKLARYVEEYMEAFYSKQPTSRKSKVYKNIRLTIYEMHKINDVSIGDKIFDLRRKLKDH